MVGAAPVRLDRNGYIATITLDRPEKLNALDLPARQALAASFTAATEDEAVRVIIVTGGDTVFAAGADVRLLADKSPSGMRDLDFAALWRPVAECPKPVIAAVAGYALGAGCELALMADIILADATAQFGLPECKLGVMPGAGGTQRLLRAIGKPAASHLLLTGGMLQAARAYELGLVSELVAAGTVEEAARKIAGRIALLPPLALAAIKRCLAIGGDLPLPAALALENREFMLLFDTTDQKEGMAAFLMLLFDTTDQKEGMAAFLDKRKPAFTGA